MVMTVGTLTSVRSDRAAAGERWHPSCGEQDGRGNTERTEPVHREN